MKELKIITTMAKITRSAKTGKFITKNEAKKNPDTTVTEKLRNINKAKDNVVKALGELNKAMNEFLAKL